MECQWFKECHSEATTSRPGPVLDPTPRFDNIPCCKRCADFADGNNTN